ncbi:MAG TPA: DUF4097 family beta strand repeat-containing protein [Solirubrobacteraceae bacterium]
MATTEPTLTMPVPSSSSPSPGSPGRRILIGIGTILVVGLILGGAFTLIDIAARHSFDVRASYAGVQSLEIDDDTGDVRLTSAPEGSRLTVTEHVTQGLVAPRRAAAFVHGVLRLTTDCRGFDPECRVRYAVAVPTGTPVTASSGAGTVTASHLASARPILLSSGAGDVIADNVWSDTSLQLSSGAGDVSASRIGSPQLRVSSGAGDVTADVSTRIGNLVARSGAGDVTLHVPFAAYAVHATSGAGTVTDHELSTNPASPRRIDATSGAGDVTITPTG